VTTSRLSSSDNPSPESDAPPVTLRRFSRAALFAACASATLAHAVDASAFCGFYVAAGGDRLLNNATQVALMRSGQRTVLSMSNQYEGPPQDFAMVVPVPIVLQQENVRTLPHELFEHLEQVTAPRLVEYWERDPCQPEPELVYASMSGGTADMNEVPTATADIEHGVRIEARFTVGEYQVLVLSATQSSGLETWLRENRYNIPQGAAEALAPYVREGMKFFVARVDIARVRRLPSGRARLSPLRFHYDSQDFRLPVRLGLLNAPTNQELVVYVLHPTQRFEVANLPNVFIPTNLDVSERVRANFPSFFNALFDATMQRMNNRAVVTEYAWTTQGCDPCTGPVLDAGELSTLGADVLNDSGYHTGMTVTRLHTRYSRETLSDDLVFNEAQPAVGGREHAVDANGGLERGGRVEANGTNNFQARYAIRHPWEGPITCRNPRRGVWGGPPNGAAPSPVSAKDLAETSRAAISIPDNVYTAIPELSVRGSVQRNMPGAPRTRACGCTVPGAASRPGWLAALAGASVLALGLARAARRRPSRA
jgi:hypothetical protein